MVSRYYSSNAIEAALTSPISPSAVTINVDSVAGFPGSYPYTLSIDAGTGSKELVEVTSAVGTALTVTRGVDGTSAVSHALGATVRHDHSARDFRESREHEDATTAHGVSGSIVGTTDTQTLTNKDLSSGTNTFPSNLVSDSDLTAGLAGKANTSHTHAMSDVTGLATALATAEQDAKNYADAEISTASTNDRKRSNHTGTQLASTISNFDTQVRTSRLDQMAAPTSDLSMNNKKLTNLAAPTNAGDAVNYGTLLAMPAPTEFTIHRRLDVNDASWWSTYFVPATGWGWRATNDAFFFVMTLEDDDYYYYSCQFHGVMERTGNAISAGSNGNFGNTTMLTNIPHLPPGDTLVPWRHVTLPDFSSNLYLDSASIALTAGTPSTTLAKSDWLQTSVQWYAWEAKA